MDQVFSDYNRTRGYLNSCYGHCPPPHMNRSSYTDEAQNVYGSEPDNQFSNWYEGHVTAVNYPQNSADASRSEEHTYELQSLLRISYAVFCFKQKKQKTPRFCNN